MSVRLFVIFALLALPCVAQTQDSSGHTPSTEKPAKPPSAGQPATQPEKKPPKKVWTNDDIGSIGGAISVVGNPAPSKSDPDRKKSGDSGASTDLRRRQIANYRNQIRQFQSQMEVIDARIAQLRNFKGENTSPSGGINIDQDYNMVPLEDQVKQLEEQRKQLQKRIDDLEDDARKNGIDPGDLR